MKWTIEDWEFEDLGDGTVFRVTNTISGEVYRFEPEDEPWEDADDLLALFLRADGDHE